MTFGVIHTSLQDLKKAKWYIKSMIDIRRATKHGKYFNLSVSSIFIHDIKLRKITNETEPGKWSYWISQRLLQVFVLLNSSCNCFWIYYLGKKDKEITITENVFNDQYSLCLTLPYLFRMQSSSDGSDGSWIPLLKGCL